MGSGKSKEQDLPSSPTTSRESSLNSEINDQKGSENISPSISRENSSSSNHEEVNRWKNLYQEEAKKRQALEQQLKKFEEKNDQSLRELNKNIENLVEEVDRWKKLFEEETKKREIEHQSEKSQVSNSTPLVTHDPSYEVVVRKRQESVLSTLSDLDRRTSELLMKIGENASKEQRNIDTHSLSSLQNKQEKILSDLEKLSQRIDSISKNLTDTSINETTSSDHQKEVLEKQIHTKMETNLKNLNELEKKVDNLFSLAGLDKDLVKQKQENNLKLLESIEQRISILEQQSTNIPPPSTTISPLQQESKTISFQSSDLPEESNFLLYYLTLHP